MPTAKTVQLQDAETGVLQYPITIAEVVDGLSDVATTGSYNDLSDKPTIPAAQVNSDWNASSGVAQILNKPTIPAAQIQSDWNQTDITAKDFIKNKPSIPEGNKIIEPHSTPSSIGLTPLVNGFAQDIDMEHTNGVLIFSEYADNIAPNVQTPLSGGGMRYTYRLNIDIESSIFMQKIAERKGERFLVYVSIDSAVATSAIWSLYGPLVNKDNYICCSYGTSLDGTFTNGSEHFFEYEKTLSKSAIVSGTNTNKYTGLFGITVLDDDIILID